VAQRVQSPLCGSTVARYNRLQVISLQPIMTGTTPENSHWIVQLNHKNRTGSFALLFSAIAVHLSATQPGWLLWTLLTLQFLLYPHLIYWRARHASSPLRTELNSLLLDALLFGVWISLLGFPLWISYTMVIGITINLMVFRGPLGMVQAATALMLGIALAWLVQPPYLTTLNHWLANLLCIVGLTLYLMMVGNVAFSRNIRIREAREQLRASEAALQEANHALHQQLAEINLLQQQLRAQADRDPLTGAYNRRYFDVSIERELVQCSRHQQALALILIDIDHFKTVNDEYGHQAGDLVLTALADVLSLHSRASDIVCRYGGEEFLVALPNTDADTAKRRAEHYRAVFANLRLDWHGAELTATISLGVASFPRHGSDIDALLRSADLALYRAKHLGRNRVELHALPEPP